jgi:thymidylate synthase
MQNYHELLQDILDNGIDSDDRTGTGTLSVFGRQMRFDLSEGFPLITTKKVFFKGILIETLWIMGGHTNIRFLKKHGVNIWDEWAGVDGDLGPVYGRQWRNWKYLDEDSFINLENSEDKFLSENYGLVYEAESVDQLKSVIERIKTNSNCRRLIVSAWNAPLIPKMRLPPCHAFFQFYVRKGRLSCQLYQRSADMFLGTPFNIASYALLTHLVANECGLEVGEFVHTFGDAHIYKNHIDQVKLQLSREHKEQPTIKINLKQGELMHFIDRKVEHMSYEEIKSLISLENYQSHPAIKAEVSV